MLELLDKLPWWQAILYSLLAIVGAYAFVYIVSAAFFRGYFFMKYEFEGKEKINEEVKRTEEGSGRAIIGEDKKEP